MESEIELPSQLEIVGSIRELLQSRFPTESDLVGDRFNDLAKDVLKVAEQAKDPKGRQVAIAVGLAQVLCRNPGFSGLKADRFGAKLAELLSSGEGRKGKETVSIKALLEGILELEGYDALEAYLPELALVAGGGRVSGLKAVDPHEFFGCFHRFAPPFQVPPSGRNAVLRSLARALDKTAASRQLKPGFLGWLCEWSIAVEVMLQGVGRGGNLDEGTGGALSLLKESLESLEGDFRWKAELLQVAIGRVGPGAKVAEAVGPANLGSAPAPPARRESPPAGSPISVNTIVDPPFREISQEVLGFVGEELKFHLLAIAEAVKKRRAATDQDVSQLRKQRDECKDNLKDKIEELGRLSSAMSSLERALDEKSRELEAERSSRRQLEASHSGSVTELDKIRVERADLLVRLGVAENGKKEAMDLLVRENARHVEDVRMAERRGRNRVLDDLRSMVECDMLGLGHQVEQLPESASLVKEFWRIFSEKVQGFFPPQS